MSSKKLGSPLSPIFQQWISSSSVASSYRILLQTTYSLQTRISAAEPVENPHLYRRAGVATPQDQATRDIYGGGEAGWLLRLVELAVQQQQQQYTSNDAPGTTNITSIVFITTRARPKIYSIIDELPHELRTKVKVIDLSSQDPFGWDKNSNGDKNAESVGCYDSSTNMNSLPQLYQRLLEEFSTGDATTNIHSESKAPVILIWQSLTPLILVHGFPKILGLLCALPTCLQVWPVNVQVMTPKQHAQLEDASNALLCMRDGEMTMIRQGVRERGNIVREKLPFRLTASFKDGQRRFRVVEGVGNEHCWDDVDDNDGTNNNINNDKDGNLKNKISVDKIGSVKSSNGSRSRGVQLLLEEEDSFGGRNAGILDKVKSEEKVSAPNRPRIYMEDNDPEFDDFDEEDPDDDLEI